MIIFLTGIGWISLKHVSFPNNITRTELQLQNENLRKEIQFLKNQKDMPSDLQDELKSDALKLRKVEKNENSIDKEQIKSSKSKPNNQTKKAMTQKKKIKIQNLKKKGKINQESSKFVTSGLDTSITQLFKERKQPVYSK